MVFTAKSEIEVGEQMAEEETNGAIDEEPMGDAVAHPDDKSADGNGKGMGKERKRDRHTDRKTDNWRMER